ncbi:hypothetical protein [Limnohabitans sp. G3-2]|uniref:hypothetical protein n=1 Tax=Limnohabitans sp. G3-2 TaxID=1100711 RepID=UPI001179BF66|nr:hypothetical protein [Limnohabitans sp. G3-2]
MHGLAHWWQRWARGAVRHAWGMAPMDGAWLLAGLVRQSSALVKVQTWATWRPLSEADTTDLSGLSAHLRQHARARGGAHRRLNMALPRDFVHEGFIDFPLEWPEKDWLYEVQLDVAQALQLAPDEVHFDFEPAPYSDGLVRRVHWVGCAQAQMAVYKNCIRAAGWRLAAVEMEQQAAQRGVRALKGGSLSLLTQAPQDWQFELDRVMPRPPDASAAPSEESDDTIAQALDQIMRTPGGARLVAAGLALKAWH